MHLPILEKALRSNTEYETALNSIQGSISTGSVVPDQLAPLFISTLWKDLGKDVVLITPDAEQASKLFSQIKIWANESDSILIFPESESLTYERTQPESNVTQQRIQLLSHLTGNDTSAKLIIASVSSLQQKTLDKTTFVKLTHKVELDSKLSMSAGNMSNSI